MNAAFWSASLSLFRREMTRFLRQRHRVVGALGTPMVFWFLIGSGLGRSFQAPMGSALARGGGGYLQYFFPGTILLILLFTAIFSTISIIEDRNEGFLQGVLVSPVDRSVIVTGKLLGGAALATGQGLVFLLLAPLAGLHLSWAGAIYAATLMAVVSFSLTGLGFVIAWKLDSTQGFHAIMNLFLMPLWFLSGALFPPEGAPTWLRAVMTANPLTYGLKGLQAAFNPVAWEWPLFPGPAFCLLVSAVFGAVMFAISWRVVEGGRPGGKK